MGEGRVQVLEEIRAGDGDVGEKWLQRARGFKE